jgi:hypothetical protein
MKTETIRKSLNSRFFFNFILTVIVVTYCFTAWLFSPATRERCNIDSLVSLPDYTVGRYLVGALGVLVAFTLGPLTIWLVWNRFVRQKFSVGTLSYGEAYTIYVVLIFLSAFIQSPGL